MSHRDAGVSISRNRDILACCAVISVALAGNANVSLKPILIGSYVEFLTYSPSLAGYVLTAEATATSLGTAVAALFVSRLNRRRMVFVSLAIILAGDLLSLTARSFPVLTAVRAFTGVGHGIALAVTAASIAAFNQSDRMAGIVTIGVSTVGMCLLFFIPWAQMAFGIGPLFLTMASLVIPPLLVIGALPLGAKGEGATSSVFAREVGAPSRNRVTVLITLTAVCFFYISVGSFWPFAEQLGRAAGLSYQAASRITALGAMATIFGSFAAIGCGNRFGRVLPMGGSIGVAIAGLAALLMFPHSKTVVSVVVVAYMFCWATLFPFLMGFASQLDPGGRINGFVLSIGLIGFAVGPGVGSWIITLGSAPGSVNLMNLIRLSALCLLPSFALVYAVKRHSTPFRNATVEC